MTRENRRSVRAAFNETLYWLRRAGRRELLTPEQVEKLRAAMDDLGRRIGAYLKRVGLRNGPTAAAE
jgi:hypothetical protein